MSDLVASLKEKFEECSLVVERGGQVLVRGGKSEKVVAWLIETAFGRRDKNSHSFVFFGLPNTVMVELTDSEDGDVGYSSLPLRAVTEEAFVQTKSEFDSRKGEFEKLHGTENKNSAAWFCIELGFAIRLMYRPMVPQDPGVTQGSHDPKRCTLEFGGEGPDEAADTSAN